MAPPLQQLHIPDFFSVFNVPSDLNPHEEEVRAETEEWMSKYSDIFTKSQWNHLLASNIPRLASRTYPYATYEKLRICSDFLLLIFSIDDLADDEDKEQGFRACTSSVDAMQKGAFPSSRNNVIEDYRSRLFKLIGPTLQKRILKDWQSAFDGLRQEFEARVSNEILSIEEFTFLRRESSGTRLVFSHIEYALGFELPDEVYEHPVFMKIYFAALDMIFVSNDVYSYEKERVKGYGSWNHLTIIMHERSIDIQAATDYSGKKFRELFDCFMDGKANLPSWGEPLDSNVAAFVEGLRIWVVGNLYWSFECPRYFGPCYEEVRRTHVMNIGAP